MKFQYFFYCQVLDMESTKLSELGCLPHRGISPPHPYPREEVYDSWQVSSKELASLFAVGSIC